MGVTHRRWVGSTSTSPSSRSSLVVGVDEPTTARTGVIPGSVLTDYYPNATYSGQAYYDMRLAGAETNITNALFHCRVMGVVGGRLENCRILGDDVPTPSTTTNYAMLNLQNVGGTADRFYAESVDFTPDPAYVGPANTGVRGGGGTLRYCYGSNLPDGIMTYGGDVDEYLCLWERPYTTWPAYDATRPGSPSATHSDMGGQLEGGSLRAYGCKVSAVYYDPATGLPYYDAAAPEWGGRYLPITNGAGWSCLLSSGNVAPPVDFIFEDGWLEGGEIPIYIVHSDTLPTGTISFAGTRFRKGLVGFPTTRFHIIKAGAGVVLDTTGAVTCTDDRTVNPDGTSTWTPDGGSLVISNAG